MCRGSVDALAKESPPNGRGSLDRTPPDEEKRKTRTGCVSRLMLCLISRWGWVPESAKFARLPWAGHARYFCLPPEVGGDKTHLGETTPLGGWRK